MAQVEGRERSALHSLRLLLARAHIDCAEWSSAALHLEAVRGDELSAVAIAEVALLDAECALGADLPGQRAVVEHQAAKAVALAQHAADASLICQAHLFTGRVARLRDLDDAARALQNALAVAEAGGLSYERVRVLNELGTVEMLRDARADRLERAYAEASRIGAFGAAASAGVNLASAYAMTGRHARCETLAAEVGESAERMGIAPLAAACELMRGIAGAFDADQVRAEQHLQRAERLAPDDSDLHAGAWAIEIGRAHV